MGVRCKCRPDLGEDCQVCNPAPKEMAAVLIELQIEQMFVTGGKLSKAAQQLLALEKQRICRLKEAGARQPRGAIDRQSILTELEIIASNRSYDGTAPARRGWQSLLAKKFKMRWPALRARLPALGLTVEDLESHLK